MSAQHNTTMVALHVSPMVKLLDAIAFAARKHRKQRRRDADKTPFINHPIAVAQTLAHFGKVDDTTILLAAILHDVLEDTTATPADLVEHFGYDVCTLVKEVTDDKNLSSQERKERLIERVQAASLAAKQIVIADKICNLSDVGLSDPPDWPTERKVKYLLWADRVVDACRGCNPAMEARFDKVFAQRRAIFL